MADKSIPQKRKYRNDLTAEYVRSILHYECNTGRLVWKDRPSTYARVNARQRGTVAGVISKLGYRQVFIDGAKYTASRLIWLMQTGRWPKDEIDHRNTIKDDNRWKNLRIATRSENCRNKHKKDGTRSGLKGVSWNTKCQKWVARIGHEGVVYYLGIYDKKSEAYAVYCRAAKKTHQKFARLK